MSDYFYKYVFSPVKSITKVFTSAKTQESAKIKAQEIIKESKQQLTGFGHHQLPNYSKNLIRLAGLSGFTAVLMSAYGAHLYRRKNANSDLRELFNTAQYYHLMHSVALFGLPLVKRPVLVSFYKIEKIKQKTI